MTKRWFPVLWCCSVLLAPAGRAQTFRDGYRLDQYTTDQGLPAHSVHDLVQGPDGVLWVATNGGLAWFDGLRFRTVAPDDPALAIGRVGGVAAGRSDTIWFSPESGGIAFMAGGRAHRLLAGPRVYDLEQDADGTLWVLATLLSRVQNGRIVTARDVPTSFSLSQPRPTIWKDETGAVIVRAPMTGDRYRLAGGAAAPLALDDQPVLLGSSATRRLHAARRVGTTLHILDPSGGPPAVMPASGTRMPQLVDRDGRVWVSTPTHVEVYAPGRSGTIARFPLGDAGGVVTMIEDREGNVWIGTNLAGLWRVQQVPFQVVGRDEGLAEAQAMAVWFDDGSTPLIGDQRGQLWRVREGRASRIRPLGDAPVLDMIRMRDGTRWYVTEDPNGQGLVGHRADGTTARLSLHGTISTLREDPHRPGTLWIRLQDAILRLDASAPGGPAIAWRHPLGRLGRGLLIARDSSVWTSGEDSAGVGALWHVRDGAVHAYGAEAGLPAAPLRDVVQDADGTIWIGSYGAGLLRWQDGLVRAITTRDGLAEDVVSGIVPDDRGNLWLAGNRGVQRIARRDLHAVADGRAPRVTAVHYGRADGLRNPEGSGRAAVRTPDGRIWFPTYGGAAVLSPALALVLDTTPPLIEITRLLANGEPVSPGGRLQVPLGRRRVEISYRGVALRRPESVTYEHRLAPQGQSWTPVGASVTALYPALGPGRYEFAVRAVNAGGVVSAPAVVAFVVPARPHETAWFAPLILLLALAGAWQVYRWRVRHLLQRETALGLLVEARTAALANETRRAEGALATVAAQADQLRTLDEAKSRFFANVSHEFRTPLSLVLGPLEDLRAGRDGTLSDAIGRKLDRVIANGRRLVRLVEQLLDVARLEAGALRLDLEVRDLVPLLRRVTESFASLAERRGIDFRLSCPVGGIPVRFDPDQMDKVLANLLGNALKFTPAGGVVELQATIEGGDTEAVVLRIRDTGIGIPADRVDRIFDRFYQVDDSPQRAHEGTGIGLAITKELLDLHAGRIDVTSRLGVGTTFTVRLPLARDEERRPEVTPARGIPARVPEQPEREPPLSDAPTAEDRAMVLVVEDNAELREYLRDHLAPAYGVLEASDGLQGLALARQHLPDLVISDVMMPNMDGQALCAALKGSPETDFIPLILLTARASRESRLAGLTEGADDYLTKPVDVIELLARARNLVTARRRLVERFATGGAAVPRFTLRPGQDLPAGSRVFLERLNAVLTAHVGDDDFQVDAMAAALAMSRATLYRRAEAALGQSPMDVLWAYRLDQAALWLRATDATVSEVAYATGFKSVPHFSRRFRARFGATPTAYRVAATPGSA